MLRAENAEVVIHPSDRKYGALLVGGQGSGKTSAPGRLLRQRRQAPDTAPIVIDPKIRALPHLSAGDPARIAASGCGSSTSGRPAFGMNPLRLVGDRPLPVEAGAIADNVVAALLDINENQISSPRRRYLNHAVIGAIALAQREQRRAKFEDVYTLLLPAKDDFRQTVAEACADQPDLDQTAAFFRSELPDELDWPAARPPNGSTRRATRSAACTGVPSLRRFFNHPTDIPLREIIQARDILIVDANMAAMGEENSKACMLFLLRMLHTQMQRQVHLPERERPRVPLLVDEAHYIAGGENVVDQIATHRARRARARIRPAVLRTARLGLRARAEDPQGRPQPPAKPIPVPHGRRPGRRGSHADRDGRVLDDDPRRPRLPRPAPSHARAGAQLPQLLLPGLLDRQRHRGSRASWARPTPSPRRRRLGPPPSRSPGRPGGAVPRAARIDARRSRTRRRVRQRQRIGSRRAAPSGSTSSCHTRRRTTPSASVRGGTHPPRAGTSPRASGRNRSLAGDARTARSPRTTRAYKETPTTIEPSRPATR